MPHLLHRTLNLGIVCLIVLGTTASGQERQFADPGTKPINVTVPHVSTDDSVKIDYDIVYVRARRAGDQIHKRFYTDFSQPVTMESGADLMLLHPDGREELLVEGGSGSITDPVVSFDGKSVYYVHLYDLQKPNQWEPSARGADIFKIHLATRKIVRLTNQQFAPNTGAGQWASDFRNASRKEDGKTHFSYGVFNMGPCPLPGGRIAFTSNREGFRPSKGYPVIALQLFVMDDRDSDLDPTIRHPANLEKIGHLNLAGALHPVVLTDGRIMFSSLESQGIRSEILWGVWTIHPDGTNWGPLVSAFDPGGAPNGFHFQTQLTDGSVVIEEYYNQNNSGFGAYLKLPLSPPEGYAAFGPGWMRDPRVSPLRFGRFDNGRGKWYQLPFTPTGAVSLTPFADNGEGPADYSVPGDKNSPRVGKFTHPSGAPENHLLTIYSPGPVNHQYTYLPQVDGGIYLLKNGRPVEEPADLRLIKNDPKYNESWPRAVVPYKRIYGIDEPRTIPRLANDGKLSPHLPAGTPYGLIGSSSLYKRESYPNGTVPEGAVTATFSGGNDPWRGLDPFTTHGNGMPLNWHNQGADAGLYSNDDIHAIRILVQEPTTDRHRGFKQGRQFFNHASERLRILGEIPVRKFNQKGQATSSGQPVDPDGNPDTSFLARIPADTSFTFQTIDKDGMVLNMSQTWHQLRPGEIRHDCGGCHAHSQKPTEFRMTAAARPEYSVWDLINKTPVVTDVDTDESKTQWDIDKTAGLRDAHGPVSVEYFRDIQPILKRSCVACHTRSLDQPAGNLVLDADDELIQYEHRGKFPGGYYRLAIDDRARYGHKPVGWDSWGAMQGSRYIRKLQSRRSLLIWKLFGKRLDGFANEDHPSESVPGAGDLVHHGHSLDIQKHKARQDLDFTGSVMPPPDAVAGRAAGPDGKTVKVAPLTNEDRRTFVRWIDLGCPIDFDFDPEHPEQRGYGWQLDDSRPVVTITSATDGNTRTITRLTIGICDFGTGLDLTSFHVTANFPVASFAPNENLASQFVTKTQGIWEWKLPAALTLPDRGFLTVSVKDKQGHETYITRELLKRENH
ncbi:MAG: hypothetical protein WCJ09_15665 [Planctomycetota bacterium]